MANSLNRDIRVGEIVIVFGRAFVCEDGFGMMGSTSGRRVFGRWLDGSGESYISGYDIDAEATAGHKFTLADEAKTAEAN